MSDGLKTTDTMIPNIDIYSPILGIGLFAQTILSTQVCIFVKAHYGFRGVVLKG